MRGAALDQPLARVHDVRLRDRPRAVPPRWALEARLVGQRVHEPRLPPRFPPHQSQRLLGERLPGLLRVLAQQRPRLRLAEVAEPERLRLDVEGTPLRARRPVVLARPANRTTRRSAGNGPAGPDIRSATGTEPRAARLPSGCPPRPAAAPAVAGLLRTSARALPSGRRRDRRRGAPPRTDPQPNRLRAWCGPRVGAPRAPAASPARSPGPQPVRCPERRGRSGTLPRNPSSGGRATQAAWSSFRSAAERAARSTARPESGSGRRRGPPARAAG